MHILFIIVWVLSPLALIPLFIKKSAENTELKNFIGELHSSGRISSAEYISHKAEKNEKLSTLSDEEFSSPAFADNCEFGKVRNGVAVNADEKNKAKVSDEKNFAADAHAKPVVSDVRTEANKYLQDIPVCSDAENKNNVKPIKRLDTDTVNLVKTVTEKTEATKTVLKKNKDNTDLPDKKRAAAMSVLMMIGIIFVVLAGLVFSTAVWATLGELGRTCAIGIVSALFFGISLFTGRKLKLDRTSFAFYTLGTFFSAITLITAGFFGLMGGYFSVTGEGCFLLYAAALFMISLLSARGRSIFDSPAAAYISSFSGAFSAVLILVQLSDNIGVFAFLAAVLTAVVNIFVYALEIKIPDKWEKPLRIVIAALNIITLIGGISAAFGNSPLFYAAAVIFVIRSAAAAVMGFKGHRIYKTSLSAVSSLASGAFFALLIIFKLSEGIGVFSLSAAVFGILFALGMFTFNISIPEDWDVPVKMSAFILNAVGVISSFYTLMRSFGEWNSVCFAISGIYILSSFASGIMSVRGHRLYGKAPSAFVSMFTGLAFSVMLVAELSASIAIAALCLTIMLLIFVNAVYTVSSGLPDAWQTAACAASAILGLISVSCSLYILVAGFGSWDTACYTVSVLYILQSTVITIAAYCGHNEYSKSGWAVISQIIGTFFIILTFAQIAESKIHFMFYLTIFAVAYINFVHTFKLKNPEKWGVHLNLFSYFLGIFSTIFTVCQMCSYSEWTYRFYVTAAIYIAYSIAVTAMAFLKHSEYLKTHWAVISQLTGISFILILLSRFAENNICFMLCLTIFAAAYLIFTHTFVLKNPPEWRTTLKVFSYLLGIFSVIFTICQMSSYSEWTYHFYVTLAIYIAYSIAVTAMAFLKHSEYSKTHWAVISQLTGIFFSLCIIYKIVDSAELFILVFAVFAALYSAAFYLVFMKVPEKWLKTVNVTDIIFNIAAAVSAAFLVISNFGSWDIYCFLIALLYIVYTAVMGVRNENILLKAVECVISSITAYNLFCVMADENIAAPEFFLVCMLFVVTMIHQFAKPLRTLFSDIYLPAALTVSVMLCAAEHNLLGIISFGLLGGAMLIKSAEEENKLSEIFKIFLPLPASGMVLTFAYYNISNLFADMAAVNAAALAIIAAVILKIKGGNKTFYSFAFTSAVMLFIGIASEIEGMLSILLCVSILLTVLFCKCRNNLPSMLTIVGAAAVMYRIAGIASYQTEFNISLLFAAIFAAVSLAASRIFYSRRLLTRDEKNFKLDTFCAGILLALPMVHSANERVTVFAVLTMLAAFAVNLVRKEHRDDLNKSALTAASGLFTLALIFRPFLIVSDSLVLRKITLALICAFGFAFSKIWAKYPKLSENFSSAVYGICFVSLIIDALLHQNLLNTLIVLGTSAAILLYSFVSKKKRWFAVSSVSLLGLTIYMFRDFFAMIDWWVYLLIVGFILIAVSAANEYFVQKGKELKEKAGRFFEDWKW